MPATMQLGQVEEWRVRLQFAVTKLKYLPPVRSEGQLGTDVGSLEGYRKMLSLTPQQFPSKGYEQQLGSANQWWRNEDAGLA